jgi:hypothetical protein
MARKMTKKKSRTVGTAGKVYYTAVKSVVVENNDPGVGVVVVKAQANGLLHCSHTGFQLQYSLSCRAIQCYSPTHKVLLLFSCNCSRIHTVKKKKKKKKKKKEKKKTGCVTQH